MYLHDFFMQMGCWDYLIGIQEIFTTYIMGNLSVPWCLMGISICRATVPAFNFLKMLTGGCTIKMDD